MTSAATHNRGPIVCVLPDALFAHHKEGLAKLVCRGTKIVREQSASTALDSVEALGPSLLIVALSDPEMGGLVFIAKLYKRYPSLAAPAVVLPEPGDPIEPLICIPDTKNQRYDVEHYLGDSLWSRIAELVGIVGDGPHKSPPDTAAPRRPAVAPRPPAVAPPRTPSAPPPKKIDPEDLKKTPPNQFPPADLGDPRKAPQLETVRPNTTYRQMAPAHHTTPFVPIKTPPEAIPPTTRESHSIHGRPAPAASVLRPERAAPADPTPPFARPPVAPPDFVSLEIEPPSDPPPPAVEHLPEPPAPEIAPIVSELPPAPEIAPIVSELPPAPERVSPLDTGGDVVADVPAFDFAAPVRASRSRLLFIIGAVAVAALAIAFAAMRMVQTDRPPVEVASKRVTAPLPVPARPVPPPAIEPSIPNVPPSGAAPTPLPTVTKQERPSAAMQESSGLAPGRHLIPVTFKQNMDQPIVTDERAIGELLDRLRGTVGCTATVVGHASDEGEQRFNTQLGGKRAHAVSKLFQQRGVTNKLPTRSAGATDPAVSATTEEGRRANRRAEIELRCP